MISDRFTLMPFQSVNQPPFVEIPHTTNSGHPWEEPRTNAAKPNRMNGSPEVRFRQTTTIRSGRYEKIRQGNGMVGMLVLTLQDLLSHNTSVARREF